MIGLILSGLAAFAAFYALPGTTRAKIFEANVGGNTLGEYATVLLASTFKAAAARGLASSTVAPSSATKFIVGNEHMQHQ